MKKAVTAIVLSIVCGIVDFDRDANAEPFAGNALFPDVSNAEKIVLHCDEGMTSAIMYRAMDPTKFRIFIIVSAQNFIFVMDNRAETITNWFLDSSLQNMKKVEPEEWLDALRGAGPNYYRLLRRKLNDCVRE